MKAKVGDRIVVEAEKVGQSTRTGIVEEVLVTVGHANREMAEGVRRDVDARARVACPAASPRSARSSPMISAIRSGVAT